MAKYFWVFAFPVVGGEPRDVNQAPLPVGVLNSPQRNPPITSHTPPKDPKGARPPSAIVQGLDAKDPNALTIHFVAGTAFDGDEAALEAAQISADKENPQSMYRLCTNCVLYKVG